MTRRMVVAVLAVIGVSLAALGTFIGGEAVDARPEAETLRIEVDLSERTLSVLDDGQVIETHAVTIGSPAHPTPRGSFRIERVIWNPSWNPPASDWARGREPVGPGPGNPMVQARHQQLPRHSGGRAVPARSADHPRLTLTPAGYAGARRDFRRRPTAALDPSRAAG